MSELFEVEWKGEEVVSVDNVDDVTLSVRPYSFIRFMNLYLLDW